MLAVTAARGADTVRWFPDGHRLAWEPTAYPGSMALLARQLAARDLCLRAWGRFLPSRALRGSLASLRPPLPDEVKPRPLHAPGLLDRSYISGKVWFLH